MRQSTRINCALVFISLIVLEVYCTGSHNYENLPDKSGKKTGYEKYISHLWSGARLGRKKRNLDDEVFREEQKEQLDNLLQILQDNPWAIVAMTDGKRHVSSFTPRLGREVDDDFGSNDSMLQFDVAERSPLFSPRLGRSRSSAFSPRLGRFAGNF
ncbi:PBAN-type neuropeptides [Aethina tumida]|uniref:PBAN-type neuropeptides n=1 Tax=Aethina tumida TaxID=116153 RepID=UPI00096AE53C|nr:PBAN-type neuropeptides [Aethina tumida]